MRLVFALAAAVLLATPAAADSEIWELHTRLNAIHGSRFYVAAFDSPDPLTSNRAQCEFTATLRTQYMSSEAPSWCERREENSVPAPSVSNPPKARKPRT